MRRSFFIFLIISGSLLICFSCIGEKKDPSHDSDYNEHSKWSYAGETSPEHWAEIEKNSDCSGQFQSPVNIIDINVEKKVSDSSRLALFYSPATILTKAKNDGHTIQFSFDKGDSICHSDSHYNLIQIHFHEPSEHTINGVRYPIEIHLVHQSTEPGGGYTALAIFGIEGIKSEPMEQMESYLPLEVGEEKIIHRSLDLTSLFPKSKDYYAYSGSLTTPPCTENVNWIIFKNPIVVSLDEVLRLKKMMPLENYRNEQPLNGRVVSLFSDPNSFD